jgi:NAD(P)-dependent dehydrogenase (short-subunit alcohol dehydrogenase family)
VTGTTYSSALVTGAAQGLGHAVARALVARRVHVTLCDRNPAVEGVAAELGPLALGVVGDVSEVAVAVEAADQARRHGGPVDLLVNNVGNNPHTEIDAPIEEMAEAFDATIGSNLRSAVLFSRAVLPMMRERGGGHIVNVSTDHVHTCGWPDAIQHDELASQCPFNDEPRPPWGGWPWLFIYDITKWGLNGLTNVWAHSLWDERIRVNNFCLGTIDSARVRSHYTADDLPDWADTWMPMSTIVDVFLQLLDEQPGRSGDNVGLWCGHPAELPPPGRQALVDVRQGS